MGEPLNKGLAIVRSQDSLVRFEKNVSGTPEININFIIIMRVLWKSDLFRECL